MYEGMVSKMRFLLILIVSFACVSCKTNTKSLTESMGQEVIEIGAPIKELPQDIEEEPSAENEEDKSTTTTILPATKKEFTKRTNDPMKKVKDIDKIDGRKKADEEARIEKELADIYKDVVDYKADSAEVPSKDVNSTEIADKPIQRAKSKEFKFQPDSNDPNTIARFRTSIDEISCDRKLSGYTEIPTTTTSASKALTSNFIICAIFYCTSYV